MTYTTPTALDGSAVTFRMASVDSVVRYKTNARRASTSRSPWRIPFSAGTVSVAGVRSRCQPENGGAAGDPAGCALPGASMLPRFSRIRETGNSPPDRAIVLATVPVGIPAHLL